MYRLIIADDEENIRNGMANSLPWREWGYEVAAVCASGQEVLDRMEDCRPDVVLSDIRMPGMDGVELMQRLSREYPQVKIVILSGYSDFKYLNMSIRSHVAEYLLKPTDIDDFEETFRRLKAAMDHERLRRAQITESVLRHFHVWLTAMLGGVATPEDTDRFLPMLTEAGIDLDNLQVAAFVLDGHGGDERPDQVALWRRVWEVTVALPAGPLRRLSFLLGGEDMVVLYSSGEEIAPGDVRADIEAIQRAVRDGLRVTLSAGVSDLCTEPGMLPQAYEQANCSAKQSAFAGQEAVYFFSQMQKERPAGMPYFDTEQVEKALLAQDYDALRAEIDRVLLPLAESLPEYRAVDQLCLSLLFHVSLWGLRYGIQMEEVLRALGAHYTDVYQSETLAAKRDFVLACLFGCQQALAARRRSHSHAVKSVAMRVREYVDAEYCSNNNALFESYSRLVRQERIGAIYMPARREVLDFRDPNQVTTLLVKRFEALDVANPDKLGRFFFYPLQKNFLSTETYGEPRRDMVVLGSRQDLEMQVLMSQINPHFLYNTLESIVWKAGEAGRPDIGKLASSLGKLYRLSISGGLFVPLEQELEHVQMYMNIQRSRYGNKVDYEVRLHGVDPDQVEVPKLILQPIQTDPAAHCGKQPALRHGRAGPHPAHPGGRLAPGRKAAAHRHRQRGGDGPGRPGPPAGPDRPRAQAPRRGQLPQHRHRAAQHRRAAAAVRRVLQLHPGPEQAPVRHPRHPGTALARHRNRILKQAAASRSANGGRRPVFGGAVPARWLFLTCISGS